MNTEKNMSAYDIVAQRHGYADWLQIDMTELEPFERNEFKASVIDELMKEYASQQNKELIAENEKYKRFVDSNVSLIKLQNELYDMTQSRDSWRDMKETATVEWQKCIEDSGALKEQLRKTLVNLSELLDLCVDRKFTDEETDGYIETKQLLDEGRKLITITINNNGSK